MPSRLGLWLATCGPTGYAPVAPGTWGTAVGLVLFAGLRWIGSPSLEIGTILLLTVLGVWSAGVAERALGLTDPGPVVIDEVVGMLVTLMLVPVGVGGAIVGFLVFRVMDIVKPWPASRLEGLHGGLGIMADDVMAAVYGNLVMRGLVALLPAWLL